MFKSMTLTGAALTILSVMGSSNLVTTPAHATCDPDPYIGSICFTAATYCPRQYAVMDGSIIAIQDNTALYSLIGNAYGGDGRTTFGIPDSRGRVPIGAGKGPGLTFVARGQYRGTETHTLTIDQMPKHNHQAIFSPSGSGGVAVATTIEVNDAKGTSATPDATNRFLGIANDGKAFGGSNYPLYNDGNSGNKIELGGVTSTATGGGGGGTVTVGETGGSQAFYTVDPSFALLGCIATDGLYPPRS